MARSRIPGVRTCTLTALLAMAMCVGGADRLFGQQLRDLTEEALDQNVTEIRLLKLPIGEALAKLGERTGLRFKLEDKVLALMPYGQRTRVSIVIEKMPLRQGLNQVLSGLGLTMRVKGDHVHVEPAPVLERLGRRSTITEVGVLEQLAGTPWSALRREALPLVFKFDPTSKPRETFDQALGLVPSGTALQQLETATANLGWVWMPQEKSIVFMSKRDDVRRRLERLLDLSYNRIPLDEVLIDIGQRVGVLMMFEPGALQKVQARERSVVLYQKQTSARQTLERLCGNTGLSYEITDEGIHITGPEGPAESPITAAGRLVRINIPVGPGGVTIAYVLPEDELPDNVRKCGREKLEQLLQQLDRELATASE